MWDILLNDDEAMIADGVRKFLTDEQPIERLRPKAPTVDFERVRASMAELGWFGVGLPESAGGAGLGLVEEMLIQRECGRFLVSPSVFGTVMAAHVAFHAGDTRLVTEFAEGRSFAALAIDDAPDADGMKRGVFVFDWNGRDPLLYWNREGMGVFADALTDAAREACVDDSVAMHAGRLVLDRPNVWVSGARQPLLARAQILLAASLVGLAEHASDLAVEYARVREQFGKPIGSFQAIKHRCADMGVRARLAWYQTSVAGLKLQADVPDAPLQVASAKFLAAEAAHENGSAGIQIHGGIGFQAECDAHWFVKRARLYDQAGGPMTEQLDHVIARPAPAW